MQFKELKLSELMLETLELIGYDEATPIQAQAIPQALEGKDLVGQAQTGTGKTAAFGIPIIEKTIVEEGLQHIILAPSRELATQIYNEIHKLAANRGIKVIDIIGGISYTIQTRRLKEKPHIIVATPGRFIDNYDKGLIDLSGIKTFTLDEADELLNFGFLEDIKKIRSGIKHNIQTFFFTATFNKKTRQLADQLLVNPVSVEISGGLATSAKIEQKYIVTKETQKLETLVSLLQILQPEAAIIFGRTKKRVDELTEALKTLGFAVSGIQGDMRQRERSFAMKNFRDGSVKIIVGTDIMARGIDIENVDYVFNFDLPTEIEYYTHRIGRTGRAGKTGVSISFIKESERAYFNNIMKFTSSNAEEWQKPSHNDLREVKEKRLEESLPQILKTGESRFKEIGLSLASKYTPEQLGVILAEVLIGSELALDQINLSPEKGMEHVGHKERHSENRRRGGFSRDRQQGGGGFNRDRGPRTDRSQGGGGFNRDRGPRTDRSQGGGGFNRDRGPITEQSGGSFNRDRGPRTEQGSNSGSRAPREYRGNREGSSRPFGERKPFDK